MEIKTNNFDIWPKIILADNEVTINIKALSKYNSFKYTDNLSIDYIREDGQLPNNKCAQLSEFSRIKFQFKAGKLSFKHFFQGESEHNFRVVKYKNDIKEVLGNFRVYSLHSDFFCLRPFKGDFHIHSNYSDGIESPGYVAGSCRKAGFDFMALTDHRQYAPSLEAGSIIKSMDVDLSCYPGEEVHPPENPVHIVNFGGSFSVNKLFDNNIYRKEVAQIEKELGSLPDKVKYEVASSEWCFRKIREGGGVSIFCHPYWRPWERFYLSNKTLDSMFKRNKFDALEVISGFYRNEMESNALAVARYGEEQLKGNLMPVVGVSDAHGCDRDLFGWYYTVILAKSLDFPDLVNGINTFKSVAIEHVPGEFSRVTGPFRVVKFVYFLLREFYPLHDKLCKEEGEFILNHLSGDRSAIKKLACLKGRTTSLFTKYWHQL